MIRLFIDKPFAPDKAITLDEKIFHYVVHVMRCQHKDTLLCFNGKDGEWMAELQLTHKKSAQLVLLRTTRAQEVLPYCALCPALIKKDNFDFVLQKATELGVTDIYPIISEHTAHAHFNQEHAELIVREAAEQCERLTLPAIHAPLKLSLILNQLPKDCLCYCLAERTQNSNSLPANGKLAFFIGPEGGWSTSEIQFFEKNHFNFLHFDVGILRAETASIAILSCWQIGRSLYLKK